MISKMFKQSGILRFCIFKHSDGLIVIPKSLLTLLNVFKKIFIYWDYRIWGGGELVS